MFVTGAFFTDWPVLSLSCSSLQEVALALHALWTHGAVGVTHFFKPSFELGGLSLTLPDGSLGGEGNVFFPLPTPVIHNGVRARIERIFLLYELKAKTSITQISVLDSQNSLGTCDPGGSGEGEFHVPIGGPINHTGVNCMSDLVDNRTRFAFKKAQQVFFGLVIVVHLNMAPGGKARFTSVGADYDI